MKNFTRNILSFETKQISLMIKKLFNILQFKVVSVIIILKLINIDVIALKIKRYVFLNIYSIEANLHWATGELCADSIINRAKKSHR